jgi:hypothetical protein
MTRKKKTHSRKATSGRRSVVRPSAIRGRAGHAASEAQPSIADPCPTRGEDKPAKWSALSPPSAPLTPLGATAHHDKQRQPSPRPIPKPSSSHPDPTSERGHLAALASGPHANTADTHGRSRGAQPGNTNALTHGFYSSRFKATERRLLDEMPLTDLSAEIELIRVTSARFLKALEASKGTLEFKQHLAALRAANLSAHSIASLMRAQALANNLAGDDPHHPFDPDPLADSSPSDE